MESVIRRGLYAVSLVMIASLVLASGCANSNDKGACVIGSGITAGCNDGNTSGQCDMMNGSLYKKTSCSDLGFDSV